MNQGTPIADPCINICRMDPDGKFCQGCRRTPLEIGGWPRMTEQQKANVAALIQRRKESDTPRRSHRPATSLGAHMNANLAAPTASALSSGEH
ncbi:DUF1289 domain-containing protein [Variovorax sp. dw_954]|uniref:DUF1289 domain-containing protein n=1 Tax=Variovorax sp. dw_954 TaxID=2720078 RepID=UPI001BD6AA30